VALLLALPLAGCRDKGAPAGGDSAVDATPCTAPEPGAETTLRVGESPDMVLLPNGRRVTPTGTQVDLGGLPSDVVVGPDGRFAYITNDERRHRSVQVVDLSDGSQVQDLSRTDAWIGLALSPDGSRLYASQGGAGGIDVYDVDAETGQLSLSATITTDDYPAGLALSPDGQTLYAALYQDLSVAVIDTASLSLTGTLAVDEPPTDLVLLPDRQELYVSGLSDQALTIIDLAAGAQVASIPLQGDLAGQAGRSDAPAGPTGLVASPDGRTVYAALSNGDAVVAVDTATRQEQGRAQLSLDLTDTDGTPLGATGPTDLALDPDRGQLYVARAFDDAVTVLDADSLADLGSFPTGWYPAALALSPDGGQLLVAQARGTGSGPHLDDTGTSELIHGSLALVRPDELDLAATTVQVQDDLLRPQTLLPFDCATWFPVPTTSGGETPITHVVLIVKENKTFDSELGDLEGAEAQADMTLFGEEITPNLHALARTYSLGDNFYTDSETSTQGHLWLTSLIVTDFMEKSWIEDYHGSSGFGTDPVTRAALPPWGTFFRDLLEQGVDFTIYGEITGTLDKLGSETVFSHVDTAFPGVFFNLDISDEDKANYVADQLLDEGHFPPFTYLLLPRDHTYGYGSGHPTPEAMINDNDVGMGVLIDRLSHSPEWEHTVVFVVEDDPQQGADHIDSHRSFLLVASPWARRGHVSHVLASFPSMFATIEHILGVPPMNRYDATATPLYDMFTAEEDLTPYESVARTVQDAQNPPDGPGAALSATMDFSGPDKNPMLGELLWWQRKGSSLPGGKIEAALRTDPDPRHLSQAGLMGDEPWPVDGDD